MLKTDIFLMQTTFFMKNDSLQQKLNHSQREIDIKVGLKVILRNKILNMNTYVKLNFKICFPFSVDYRFFPSISCRN